MSGTNEYEFVCLQKSDSSVSNTFWVGGLKSRLVRDPECFSCQDVIHSMSFRANWLAGLNLNQTFRNVVAE